MTLYIRQQKRHTCKNRLLDSVGEGNGGMFWENSIEICIVSYVKQIASPGSVHETGCSGLMHWDDPEKRDGERGWTGVQDGEHIYTHGWFMSMYGKNQYNQIRSVAQSCLTLCDPMNCSTPGLPIHHQLPEFTQIHVHRVSDAIQPSHPLSFPSPPASNPSQHQSLFQWINSLHEVAKVLEIQH